MFDHVKFGVSDYAASKAFFLKALEPLGVTHATEWPPNGIELCPGQEGFIVSATKARKACTSPFGIRCQDPPASRSVLSRGSGGGRQDNGAPGLRPHYHANYYAAFVIGPDGHNIEAVCHESEA